MQILKETLIDWRERKLIITLYMDHGVKVRLDQGETRSVNVKEESDKDIVCNRLRSSYTADKLPTELSETLEVSKL
jgi:hypothetical protein